VEGGKLRKGRQVIYAGATTTFGNYKFACDFQYRVRGLSLGEGRKRLSCGVREEKTWIFTLFQNIHASKMCRRNGGEIIGVRRISKVVLTGKTGGELSQSFRSCRQAATTFFS